MQDQYSWVKLKHIVLHVYFEGLNFCRLMISNFPGNNFHGYGLQVSMPPICIYCACILQAKFLRLVANEIFAPRKFGAIWYAV